MQLSTQFVDDIVDFHLVVSPFCCLIKALQVWVIARHGEVMNDPDIFIGFVRPVLIEEFPR